MPLSWVWRSVLGTCSAQAQLRTKPRGWTPSQALSRVLLNHVALRSTDQDVCSSRSKRLPASGWLADCRSGRRQLLATLFGTLARLITRPLAGCTGRLFVRAPTTLQMALFCMQRSANFRAGHPWACKPLRAMEQ